MSTATHQPNTPENTSQTTARKKTALITAPSVAKARELQTTLDRLGMESSTVIDADLPGRTIPEIVQTCLESADVVVGVLADGPMKHNLYFELGMAYGIGKRILLLLPDAKAVPTAVSLGVPYILAEPDNAEAIEFALAQILARPHNGNKPTEHISKQTHPINGLADKLLAELRDENRPLVEKRLEEMICQAVKASGAITAAKNGAEIDLAVWSDDLAPWVHNPLIVEIRKNIESQDQAKTIVKKLRGYMEKVHVSTALVIYQVADPSAETEKHAPDVLFIPAETFLASLRDVGFGDVVRQLRNRSVLGAE